MQLFCALLTGFFLWLLAFQWRRNSLARLRARAGKVEYSAKSIRPPRWRWILFAYFLFCMVINIYNEMTSSSFPPGSQFGLAILFSLVLILGIPSGVNTAVEVCEKGLLCGKCNVLRSMGRLVFVPWNQITECQWVPCGFGHITNIDVTCNRIYISKIRNRITIAKDSIALDQQGALTAALGRFVPVYDPVGTLLAKPEHERNLEHISWKRLEDNRFRFDRQTTLLLAVVVACFAGMFGLYYASPYHRAIAKLITFGPDIHYYQDGVYSLDFSSCATKPNDDDLVNLEPLRGLVNLDLSGCPITDAGLQHLKGLTILHFVFLGNTGVTSQGVEDLQQALPQASVHKDIVWVHDAAPQSKDGQLPEMQNQK